MTAGNSTVKSVPFKPRKPYDGFPLFAHKVYWAKKVKGRFVYFRKWRDDPDGKLSLEDWYKRKDDLEAGRRPARQGQWAVADALDHFHEAKRMQMEAGELTRRTFDEYVATCKRISEHFGSSVAVADLTPADFADYRAKIAKRWGPARLGTEIQRVRTTFKFQFDNRHIDQPVQFGSEFKKPSKKVERLLRSRNKHRQFSREEILSLLDEASLHLRAMILLGVNGGMGNTDVAELTLVLGKQALETGWLDYPRQKTGIDRRIPLWPETREAMRK